MARIVKRGQPGITYPCGCLRCGPKRVGLHHIDEDTGHPEVHLLCEQRLERLTGTPNTKRSSRRLDSQNADMIDLSLKPRPQRVEPALETVQRCCVVNA